MRGIFVKKYISRIMSVLVTLSVVGAVSTKAEAKVAKNFSAPIRIGAPIQSIAAIDAVYGKEDGNNVMYTTVSGSASSGTPAVFNVVDIDNQI